MECDVRDYDDVAKLFTAAKENFGRVDFGSYLLFKLTTVAANAGVRETFVIPKPLEPESVPSKPMLPTLDVNLYGPVYAAYLAIHYFRTNSPPTGGRFIVTSSAAGLYGLVNHPTYCAAKFGCIGLIRSLGLDKSLMSDGITFNAICPGVVETGMAPPVLYDYIRKTMPDIITPMSTVLKAFNMILEGNMTGDAFECSGDQVVLRPQHDPLADHWDRLSLLMGKLSAGSVN